MTQPQRKLFSQELGDDQAYSKLAGAGKQELMLQLRFRSGNLKALSYAYLVSLDYNPSTGIALEFTGHKVKIQGTHLDPLVSAITRHRIAYVQEASRPELAGTEDTTIDKIEVTDQE